ncbi:MAG: hypothetical protein KGO96_04850 [Elusimicrobia bacterium]|nr:hypothetical protein [Elusimicrobiota bacterium]MDE2236980.1 hypothetical protein [Elusimicrobiota bacterium]MDE2425219.1 hypothetical protein [Elusimicrobiota bacterium]
MGRRLLYGLGVCAALAAAAVLILYLRLGAIAKYAVETLGSRLTGTEVRVDSVSLSPFSGRGRLRGLSIANPPGFKSPCAFLLKDVRVAVDLASLRSDRVLIREILVDGPELTFETSPAGSNLVLIQRHIDSFTPASAGARGAKTGASKKVAIDLFRASHGKVNVRLALLEGKILSVSLPGVELRGIGRRSGGATSAQAAKEMLRALIGSALKAAAGAGGALREQVRRGLGGAQKTVGGILKGWLRAKH